MNRLNKSIDCRGMMLVLVFAVCSAAGQATERSEPVDIGRHIYIDGLLPGGEPLTALVAGDVPIAGTQFSCESCHGRSGMGAGESTYIVPPIAGPFLFSESPQPKRPPYDVTSLARVLREGVTPSGRTLDRLMPRFRLSDDDIASLAAYLATLSADNSPGVDDRVIRFGTVMTEDVDPAERKGVLAVLGQFFEEKNRQTRLDSERWDRGYTPESRLPTVFRQWHLDVWTLTGQAESWGEQLERYYAAAPVFALVSGLGGGDWGPVSRFCEKREIPCLFPGADLPDAQAGDFYTLYFSRGMKLEADLIAAHLASHPAPAVVQVFCDAQTAGAAAGLRQALAAGGQSTNDLALDCDKPLPTAGLSAHLAANPDAAAVLWLRPSQLTGLEIPGPSGRIYVSSTLLGDQAVDSLRAAPGPVFEAYAFKLPGEADPALRRFSVWAKTRKIELTAPRRQAEAYFACMALGYTVKHMRRFFLRDYALDMLEHSQGLAIYLPYHPRPTFGPDQRFLNKGGYVLPVVNGKPEAANAEWILP